MRISRTAKGRASVRVQRPEGREAAWTTSRSWSVTDQHRTPEQYDTDDLCRHLLPSLCEAAVCHSGLRSRTCATTPRDSLDASEEPELWSWDACSAQTDPQKGLSTRRLICFVGQPVRELPCHGEAQ